MLRFLFDSPVRLCLFHEMLNLKKGQKMENFRKLVKIAALNQKMPGPVCGNPDCEDLCAEAYDAALSLRLDPAETIRKTIERELRCLPADAGDGRACRFGFIPASDSLVLNGEKKEEEDEVVHIFRTGGNECKDCRDLNGTEISPEEWADKEKMREKGFPFQENGQYIPHPHCRCRWEEKLKSNVAEAERTDLKRTVGVTKYNKTRDSSFTGKEVEFYVKGGPKKFENHLGVGYEVDGFESLLKQLEDNYPPHSIGNLRIIGHGDFASTPIGGDSDTFQALIGSIIPRHKRIVSRLKRMLSSHSIIEFRMCNVGGKGGKGDENGPEFAQRLANLLGCRAKVYLEPVNPYGWRPIADKEDKKIMPGNFGRQAEYEIYAPQP